MGNGVGGKTAVCGACAASVTWVVFPDGTGRPIERCPDGAGDVAIQPQLPGLGPRRLEARVVSGVRTAYRLHVPHCARAAALKPPGERRCMGCRVPLEGTRASLCFRCQTKERDRMAEVVGRLVERFGESGAREHVARALADRRARRQ